MKKAEVCRYVYSLGISPKHKGFAYICDTLCEMLEAEGLCGCDRARAAVCPAHKAEKRSAERCMRYAICCAWDVRRGAIRGLFTQKDEDGVSCGPPTLAEFLCVAAWLLASRYE